MFNELDTNLKAINGEVSKLQSAVENINQAKSAAQKAVETADKLQDAFGKHLKEVTQKVDNILQPHIELIKATEQLTKTIAEVNFPERFDKQEKEINLLKIVLFATLGISILSVLLPLLMK